MEVMLLFPIFNLSSDPQVVRPLYGDFNGTARRNNASAAVGVEKEKQEEEEEGVIHDITGTTVYVVGVICIIPTAGLVAWVVRYVSDKSKSTKYILKTPW